jgi:hypothetical protein
MALYEEKPSRQSWPGSTWRASRAAAAACPNQHALLELNGYHQAKSLGAVRAGLAAGRQTARLLAEEVPAALALAA